MVFDHGKGPDVLTTETSDKKLDEIQTSVDLLTRGFGMMAEVLGTHSEMLKEILTAVSMEPPESTLDEALEKIAEAINEQTVAITAIGKTLDHLDTGIEAAVRRGVEKQE